MKNKRFQFAALIVLFNLFTIVGCSQHNTAFKAIHPGTIELIDLGESDDKLNPHHAYKVKNKIIYATSTTTHPSVYSAHLLEHTEINKGESVLDIGTGTGIQAVFAAEKASHILATDINKDALENTLLNARRLGLANKISVRESDLFNAIKPEEKFDVIISAIPFAWNVSNQGNWKLQERFFRDVGKHLKPNGRIYFSTGYLRNMPRTKAMAEKNGLKIIRVNMDYSRIQDIEPVVYVFKHEKYAKWLAKDLVEKK